MDRDRTNGADASFSSGMFRILRKSAFLLLFFPALAASESRSWLHVEVDQPAEERNVRVRLPLAVVETLSATMQDELFEPLADALESTREEDADLERFRKLWRSLRENPGAVVEVREGGNETLTARMDGSLVRIEGAGEDGDLRVRIPVELGDAFFAQEPDPETLAAAIRKLGETDGELVSVENEEGRVRIWVGPAESVAP